MAEKENRDTQYKGRNDKERIRVMDLAISPIMGYRKENCERHLAIFYCHRSLVRIEMGDFTKALEDAKTALEYDPNMMKAHWCRGCVFNACGDTREALLLFEKALELEPNNKALKKEIHIAREKIKQENRLGRVLNKSKNSAQDN